MSVSYPVQNKEMKKGKILINGKWRQGNCDLISIDPATGETIGKVSMSGKKDVVDAVKAARQASISWHSIDISQRSEFLKKAINVIHERSDKLKELIVRELGKPYPEASVEVDESADMLAFFAEEGKNFLESEYIPINRSLFPNKVSYTRFEPIGVVAVIKPWNYPFELPIWSIGAALITGNTVVFKPSELAPFVGLEIGTIFQEAGLPEGVLNVITGDGKTGEYLVDSNVDMVAFTGSIETGKRISRYCADKGCRVSLELGGKDPAIVCEDADIGQAVNGLTWGSFANCGQVCVSAERIYVHQNIAEEFIARFVEKASTLKLGNGLDPSVDIGPLVSQKQLDKVETHVKDAIAKRAKILTGGQRPTDESLKRGFYFLPTVLSEVNNDMKVMTEETFGPIAPIMTFSTDDEAIRLANQTSYGLGASIWTTNLRKANYISEMVQAGMVWVNDINIAYPQCPWGGVKKSGHGKELSKYGIREFLNIKHINVDFGEQETRDWWFPYKR